MDVIELIELYARQGLYITIEKKPIITMYRLRIRKKIANYYSILYSRSAFQIKDLINEVIDKYNP